MNFNQPVSPERGSSNFKYLNPDMWMPPNTLNIYDDVTVINPQYCSFMLANPTPLLQSFHSSIGQRSNLHLQIIHNNNIQSVGIGHNQIPAGSHNYNAFGMQMRGAGGTVDRDRLENRMLNSSDQPFTPDSGSSNFRNLHSHFGMPPNNILTINNNVTAVHAANSSSMLAYSLPLGPRLNRDESFQNINSFIVPSSNLHPQMINANATNNIQSLDFGHNQIPEGSHYDAFCTQIQGVGDTVDHDRPREREKFFTNQPFVPDRDFSNFTYIDPRSRVLPNSIITSNDNVIVVNETNAENCSSMLAHRLHRLSSGMQLNNDKSLQNNNSFSGQSPNLHLQMVHDNATNNIQSLDIEHNQIPESSHIYDAFVIQTQGAGYTVDNERPNKRIRIAESSSKITRDKCCNCNRSGCLKRYCPCFAKGDYCVNPCSCNWCYNSLVYERKVSAARAAIELRDPYAFDHKVVPVDKSGRSEIEVTNTASTSVRHRRGCNCKKSNCGSKYCECHEAKVRCSELCRCVGCKNGIEKEDGNKIKLEAKTKDENLHTPDDKSKVEVGATNDLEKQDDSIHAILNQCPTNDEDQVSSTTSLYSLTLWPPSPPSASLLGIT